MPPRYPSMLLRTASGILASVVALCGGESFADDRSADFFENRIRPVLVDRCYECHNSSGRAEAGLALDYREGLLRGGDSGPAVDPTRPLSSLLLEAVRHAGGLRMPKGGPKLSDRQVADFQHWLEAGAYDPRDTPPSHDELSRAVSWEAVRQRRMQWWSFQPVREAPVPEVDAPKWSGHPVDRFLYARLSEQGLRPQPVTDRRTLIRRLSFALTGLPPTVAEVARFKADESADAYESLVDRLLDSPHFGHRWARHWMDWLRYADSHGSEGDPAIPNAWRYRDYLIRALNSDIGYDQLVREHIAGDLLRNPRVNEELGINESTLGTSHFRFVEHGYAPTDALEELVRTTDNQIDVLSKAFVGLTVSCARCHDHKFDPISQEDFYSLYGVLTSCRPAQVTIDTPARQATNKRELRALKTPIRNALADAWIASLDAFPALLRSLPPPSTDTERRDEKAKKRWSASQRMVNAAEDEGLINPLHPWVVLRQSEDSEAPGVWDGFVGAWRESQTRIAERKRADYPTRWELGGSDADPWFQHGSGMANSSAQAGAFHVAAEGERVIAGVYPAGVYSHLISSKHSGQFTSPSFTVNTASLWVRAAGAGARTRYVMSHYRDRRGRSTPRFNSIPAACRGGVGT